MPDTDEEVVLTALPNEPDLAVKLRTYGLSGEPVRMAPSTWQPAIVPIRAANVGEMAVGDVQPIMDALWADEAPDAAEVCLAHPPVGDFTLTQTMDSVRVDLAGDVDLLLPDENVEWDFGDGTVIRDAGGWDHQYTALGTHTVKLSVVVAGRVYGSSQEVTVESLADPREADDDAAFDPAEHTVDEVVAYAKEHPDEVDALIEAEDGGKGRITLLDKLEAMAVADATS